MKLEEVCSCGAKITAKSWAAQDAYDVIAEWRRVHVCPNRPRAPGKGRDRE